MMRGEHTVGAPPAANGPPLGIINNHAIPGGNTGPNSAYQFKTADGYKSAKEINAEPTASPYGAYGKTDEVSQKIAAAQEHTGTSIFDPVLCELAYRWFCPPGGKILDPFAGGSVRGIVAAKLGRHYTGVDLRAEQIAANERQAVAIGARPAPATVDVKISAAMARLEFNGCDPEYIRTTCHASCCDSSTSPTGTMISIHPDENAAIVARGGRVELGLLQPRPGEKKCPFKDTGTHLCGLHFTPDKPFGCIASPFTLNDNNTLIVRNRYKLLKCYDDGRKIPAYHAFRASLALIFGDSETERIVAHFDAGGGDVVATMPIAHFRKLKINDETKKGHAPAEYEPATDWVPPTWVVGDSKDVATLAPGEYDFVFSCPPYGDLEVYSDNPADLSTMDYAAFKAAYFHIIRESVAMLKPNRFACFVVGDFRYGPHGLYRNFPMHTIQAFEEAGAFLHNEAVLVTAIGSLPIRVGRQFVAGRKFGKTHQNVLVFIKGDPKIATAEIGEVEFATELPEPEPGAPVPVEPQGAGEPTM